MKKQETEQQYLKSPLNNQMLNYKVYVPGRAEAFLVRMAGFVLGGAVGLIFYGGLFKSDGVATMATYIANVVCFMVVGIVASKFLMPIYIKRSLEKRRNILKKQFRDMLESLTASFSSGSNVQGAFESAFEDLKMQYEEKDYIVREMREILNGMAQNIAVEVMMKDFGFRSGNEDIESFADVFEVCYRKGGDMKAVIHRTHAIISEKMAVADEIETKLTSNKMQHNAMSLMPIAVVALLKGTNDAFAENFATPMGVIINTVAIGIFIAAYKYGLKIVDIKG